MVSIIIFENILYEDDLIGRSNFLFYLIGLFLNNTGHLPPATEVITFKHNCTSKPCVVTLVHVPSVYPTAKGQDWDWKEAIFRIYIDNESVASIELTLREVEYNRNLINLKICTTYNSNLNRRGFN